MNLSYSDKKIPKNIIENNVKENNIMITDVVQNNTECKKRAISCLFEGLLYQEGFIKTDNSCNKYIQYRKMFTMSPSRNYFVRGFLWDEGFHNTLLMDLDIDLAMRIQSDWYNTIFENGWIPREQMRGRESEYFAPNYIVQVQNEGNPPAFILALDYLVSQVSKKNANLDKILLFFKQNISKIQRWFNWYRQ